MDNETSISLKFQNKVNGQKKLEKYYETLKQVAGVLEAIDIGKTQQVAEASKKTKQLKDNTKSLKDIMNDAFGYTKLKDFIRLMAKFLNTMTKHVKVSAEYLENLNLLDVAYNDNTDSARKFVNTLSQMYGLDESWGYRTVGMFKQLSNAMKLSDETGTKLAETLTQLSIDTASLYNVDVDTAVSKLQSALAGQTKPVRYFGADITQSTLQITLETHGIDKAVSDLSFAEKRLLIVSSILEQTKEAQGDWGRTLTSVANQMRIFQQQTQRLSRALGNVFIPILKKVLPILNGILMVLVEIVQWFAVLVGYKEEDYFDGAKSDVDDLLESIDSAIEETEKLKSGLRGFDKLNNITISTGTDGTNGTGISQDILDLFDKSTSNYLDNLDKIENVSTRIRDNIMDWLGFEKEIDEVTGEISFKFKNITIGTIAVGALATIAVANFISALTKVFSVIGSIFKKKGKGISLTQTVGVVLTIAGIGMLIGNFNSYLAGEDIWKNLVGAIGGSLLTGAGAALFTKGTFPKTSISKTIGIGLIVSGISLALTTEAKKAASGTTTWADTWAALGSTAALAGGTFLLTKNIVLTLAVTAISLVVQSAQGLKQVWDALEPPEGKTRWDMWKEGMKLIFNEVGKAIQGCIDKMAKFMDYFSTTPNKGGKYTLGNLWQDIQSSGGLWENWKSGMKKILGFASGGLPPTGQLFVANESGPELVGQIGGQSFVANQNQMLDLLDRKISSSNGGINSATFVIQVGDEQIAKTVIRDLQGMAKSNGKPITIG